MNRQNQEKRTENIAERRTHFLLRAGLFSLLQEIPFEKITTTELCSRSMVPRSTFYRYFDDKYDLLYFCMRSFLDQADLNEDIIYLKSEASMRKIILEVIRTMDSQKASFQKILQINRDGIFMEILRNCLLQILNEQLKEGSSCGLAPKISLPVFTYLLVDFYISVAKCYLELSDQFNVEQFSENVFLFANKDFFR